MVDVILTGAREERFKKLRDAAKFRAYNSKPKIQKVPYMLRDPKNFEKYYEPMAVAIGPFHHGNSRYELGQEFKLMLTSKFIEYIGQTDEELHKKIEEKIEELRACYVETATKSYDNGTLAWMLFLDGCSTLQFIYSFMHEELEKLFQIKRDRIAFIQQDLFLLENQVPYQVLELLMSSSDKHEDLKHAIEYFVWMEFITPNPKQKHQPGVSAMEKEPIHLLDLARTIMLGPKIDVADNLFNDFTGQSFLNVQELSAAGIHFKPSSSSFLGDISFSSSQVGGVLSLPLISVDDSTGPKLMNLIAYEMCPDFQNDLGVTSYICFLNALIDQPDDVMKLRSADVLVNLLGSDKKVAQLFNEMGTNLVPNNDIYCRVIADIQKHYKTNKWKTFFMFLSVNKWKTWMSQFFNEHFSSPWTFLAWMGALAALGLTGIQTWYTVVDSPPTACDAVCHYLKAGLHLK